MESLGRHLPEEAYTTDCAVMYLSPIAGLDVQGLVLPALCPPAGSGMRGPIDDIALAALDGWAGYSRRSLTCPLGGSKFSKFMVNKYYNYLI